MDNANDIIELLDILYGMVNEAWGVPLGNDKCIIEREKAIDIINDIKAALPTSIAESKRLVAARDEFIGNAKREAESLRKSAEEQAAQLVDEQEIVRVAREKSTAMLAEAEKKTSELRRLASGETNLHNRIYRFAVPRILLPRPRRLTNEAFSL